jgi:hypothetical protein
VKCEIQKDLTLKCSSHELTIDDIEELNRTHFTEDVPVTIHCNKINQAALIPFFTFIRNLQCLYINVYVEDLDYETARAICAFAKKNRHALTIKLDLGEKLLAFISSKVMSHSEAQDIEDHLISGIYSKLHTLVLEYRSMSYIQAVKLAKALLRTQLKALEMYCYTLDTETTIYLKSQLTLWLNIPNVTFFVQAQDQLQPVTPPVEPVAQPAEQERVENTTMEVNCLETMLTWVWSKMPILGFQESDDDLEDEEINRRRQHKPHFL